MINRFLFLFSTILLSFTTADCQVLFSEDFESNELPMGWSIETLATDNGWNIGTIQALSSQDFFFSSNGSNGIIGTNDDGCDCDKSNDLLITSAIDPGANSNLFLNFDLYYGDQFFQGNQEIGTVEISYDKENWEVLEALHGHLGVWDEHNISLAGRLDSGPFYIGFRYNDAGGWMFGMGIDNVSVTVPDAMELELFDVTAVKFGQTNCPIDIAASVWNKGGEVINDVTVTMNVDGVETIQEYTNLGLGSLEFTNLDLTAGWLPERTGFYDITISVSIPGDASLDNNEISFQTEIFDKLEAPDNILDIMASPKVETMDGASPNLDRPTDLDFFPINGKDELWIVNQRTENAGGSTLIVRNATQGPQSYLRQVDGNSWHFMSLPTGIAFSDENFNFATSAGVQDANHNGGTFTGPALWSSDPAIYAQPSGGNGSHLDMLHGSPFSMGIAHEVDNVFWVYDDFNSDIARYDFKEDHGPGADDHSDGEIYRYSNIGIKRILDIPNHLILDKETGWLYFTDNGNSRIMRLDINSGTGSTNLGPVNEPLAVHQRISGFTVETIIDTDIIFPSGIEIFNGKLLVGDWGTGELIAYDMNDGFKELSRIETVQGLCGIKVGPQGNIWGVNRESNELYEISINDESAIEDLGNKAELVKVFPNPSVDRLSIKVKYADQYKVSLINAQGQTILLESGQGSRALNIEKVESGIYTLKLVGDNFSHSQKVIVSK